MSEWPNAIIPTLYLDYLKKSIIKYITGFMLSKTVIGDCA